jgi:small GTP-binding protein
MLLELCNKIEVTSGLIRKIQNFYFIHDCNIYKGTSGSVIVNKINNCVVVLHKDEFETEDKRFKNLALNVGVFIKDIIEDIKSSSKGNEMNNDISIKLPPKADEIINSSMKIFDNKKEIKMTIGFVGDIAIGAKTNLIWALVNEKPSINFKNENGCELKSTVTCELLFKKINILDQTINICFIDLCGQKINLDLNLAYLRNANIIILGYDITDKESFNNIKNFWFPNIKNKLNKIKKFYLIGNKVDLEEERLVLREEAEKFAIENNFSFFEVSAYYYINVKELLSDFINSCLN